MSMDRAGKSVKKNLIESIREEMLKRKSVPGKPAKKLLIDSEYRKTPVHKPEFNNRGSIESVRKAIKAKLMVEKYWTTQTLAEAGGVAEGAIDNVGVVSPKPKTPILEASSKRMMAHRPKKDTMKSESDPEKSLKKIEYGDESGKRYPLNSEENVRDSILTFTKHDCKEYTKEQQTEIAKRLSRGAHNFDLELQDGWKNKFGLVRDVEKVRVEQTQNMLKSKPKARTARVSEDPIDSPTLDSDDIHMKVINLIKTKQIKAHESYIIETQLRDGKLEKKYQDLLGG